MTTHPRSFVTVTLSAVLASSVLGSAIGSMGCAAPTLTTVSDEQPGYLTASGVPINIEAYPSSWYDGHIVYYWNEQWVFRGPNGWAYVPSTIPQARRRAAVHESRPDPHEYRTSGSSESSSPSSMKAESRSGRSEGNHRETKSGK